MAKSNQRLELENFPISGLSMSTRLKLSELLDEPKIRRTKYNLPRDYRGLAQLVGLDAVAITNLENEQKPTEKLLLLWCQRMPYSTVGNLFDYLEELDCYYVTDDLLPLLENDVCHGYHVFPANDNYKTVSSDQPSLADVTEIPHHLSRNSSSNNLGHSSLITAVDLAFLFPTDDVNNPVDVLMGRLQDENMQNAYLPDGADLDFNFVIDAEGKIVEGTGWFLGNSSSYYNHKAESVVLLGDWTSQHPDAMMLLFLKEKFLQNLVYKGKLEPNFKFYGADDALPDVPFMQAITES